MKGENEMIEVDQKMAEYIHGLFQREWTGIHIVEHNLCTQLKRKHGLEYRVMSADGVSLKAVILWGGKYWDIHEYARRLSEAHEKAHETLGPWFGDEMIMSREDYDKRYDEIDDRAVAEIIEDLKAGKVRECVEAKWFEKYDKNLQYIR